MLVNMKEMLDEAKKGRYAVGLFNTVNMELARGVIKAAEETQSPVIIGTAEIFFPYGPLETLSYLLIPMARTAKVPVALHLDHGLTMESCRTALELGFKSVMYDCSMDEYDDNVDKVKEIVELAKYYRATVEGEIGHVGDGEATGYYTDPEVAKDYVERTGVDALAIAVGNAHGAYKLPPKLDFDRIRKIAETVDVPLVLHGGSGLTDDDFKRAIYEGISKVNIFTDISNAAAKSVNDPLNNAGNGILDMITAQVEAVKQEAIKKMELFGCVGKGKI